MNDLRAVTLNGRVRRRSSVSDRPIVSWVPIRRIRIDDSYQRGLLKRSWRAIDRIAEHFDWARFTPVLLAPIEGGLFALIDGQHRTHAANIAGHDEVPAMIVGMTKAEQARSFSWVNGSVAAITPLHIYKAALAAGETWALGSRDVVEEAGCRLMTSNKSAIQKRPGEVFAIKLIRSYVEDGAARS